MRFYADLPLALGQDITLPEDLTHHLVKVLRAQAGERFSLFNGQGGEFAAELTVVGKREAQARLLSFSEGDRESPLHTHLGQVMSKGDRMDYAIQKATELGVSEITPLVSERCELRLKGEERADKKLEHWRRIAISACEQSGRSRLPRINPPLHMNDWLAAVQAEACYVLAPALSGGPQAGSKPASVALLIGPEGGLSPAEIQAAQSQGFAPWQLGPRVLRTETAPVAALAVLQLLFGDF